MIGEPTLAGGVQVRSISDAEAGVADRPVGRDGTAGDGVVVVVVVVVVELVVVVVELVVVVVELVVVVVELGVVVVELVVVVVELGVVVEAREFMTEVKGVSLVTEAGLSVS